MKPTVMNFKKPDWTSSLLGPNSVIPITFILNIILVFPVFFPNLSDMDMWDESGYINSGRMLFEKGLLPEPAWNPFGAFLYAVTYIPVRTTTYWLIHSCTIGRFLLFGLMWLSAYLVARRLSSLLHPLIMISLLLISPALTTLLRNPSDALFTAMSAFALWQVLSFYHEKKIKHLWLASLFVGLSTLSRNDGLIIFLFLVFISISLNLSSVKRMCTSTVAVVIPFGIIVSGYVILYGSKTGVYEFGTIRRTYCAFEQGQGIAYEYPIPDGTLEVRRIFGTPEENRYSIISAIKRNPKAFLDRVRQTIKASPKKIYFMYGERLGIIILLLAVMGAVELARKKLYLILLVFLLWPAHLLVYFFTFFRHTYFLFPYFIIFSMTSIGLISIIYNLGKKMLYFWSSILLVPVIFGILTNRPNIFSAPLLFLIGLWLIRIILNQYRTLEGIKPIGIILALCFAMFLKTGSLYPKFRTLGMAPGEKAALFMKEHLEPGSLVFAEAPGLVWIAKMNFRLLDFRFRDKNEYDLSKEHLFYGKAVYVNNALRYFEPELVKKIEKLIGKGLEVGYASDKKEVQVLLVNEKFFKRNTCSKQCHTKNQNSGSTMR
jgi:hypothetical protein